MRAADVAGGFLELLLPGGCVICRRWIPGPRRMDGKAGTTSERTLICPGCTGRLRRPSWPRCPRCHRPRGSGREASPDCLECVAWPAALAAARWAFVLGPPASDLVHALKYEGWARLAAPMGDAVARAVGRDAPEGGVVVPVPTTVNRVRARGYNQAALLAHRVALRLGLPQVDALARTHAAASQTELAPEARKENVRGAFALSDRDGIVGRPVVLIDDVLTTGATACEAAETLFDAGASGVVVATFARALPFAGTGGGGAGVRSAA